MGLALGFTVLGYLLTRGGESDTYAAEEKGRAGRAGVGHKGQARRVGEGREQQSTVTQSRGAMYELARE